MNSNEILNVFDSVKQETLNNFCDSISEDFRKKLKHYSEGNNKISSIELGTFAYTEALLDSIRLNSEITLKVLIKLLADD